MRSARSLLVEGALVGLVACGVGTPGGTSTGSSSTGSSSSGSSSSGSSSSGSSSSGSSSSGSSSSGSSSSGSSSSGSSLNNSSSSGSSLNNSSSSGSSLNNSSSSGSSLNNSSSSGSSLNNSSSSGSSLNNSSSSGSSLNNSSSSGSSLNNSSSSGSSLNNSSSSGSSLNNSSSGSFSLGGSSSGSANLSACTSVTVLPTAWTLAPGASVQLEALANCGTLIPADVTKNPATVWSVVDTGSAATGTVSATGDFTGGTVQGDVTVQAVYTPAGGPAVSGNTDITISGVPVLSVAVTPAAANLHPGTLESFTATATLDGGTTQDVTLFATWSSNDANVAIASCNGIPGEVCAEDAGSATLTATYNSVAGQSALTVLPPSALVSVAVTPATTDVPQGPAVCQSFDAVGTYADTTSGPVASAWAVQPNPGLDGGVALLPGIPPTSADFASATTSPPRPSMSLPTRGASPAARS